MEVITWSNGEKYEKSTKKTEILSEESSNNDSNNKNQLMKESEYIHRKKQRDNQNEGNEILERHQIRRGYQNPFLSEKTYINVINDQEKFLTTLNSNNIN